MLRKSFLGALALGLAAAVYAAPANALTFNFSFTNALFDPDAPTDADPNTNWDVVTGTISGLNDNSTGAATSLMITSNTGGFGVGEYAPTADQNQWTVTGGLITGFNFASFGADQVPPVDLSLGFLSVGGWTAALSQSDQTYPASNAGVTSQDINLIFTPVRAGPSDVPVPASLPLLAAGIAGIALLRRRKA